MTGPINTGHRQNAAIAAHPTWVNHPCIGVASCNPIYRPESQTIPSDHNAPAQPPDRGQARHNDNAIQIVSAFKIIIETIFICTQTNIYIFFPLKLIVS